MIRARHAEFLNEEQKHLLEQKNRKKSVSCFLVPLLYLLSHWYCLFLQLKIKAKKQHISELKKSNRSRFEQIMIPKEVLQKVRHIEIKTKRIVDSIIAGGYHSAFKR